MIKKNKKGFLLASQVVKIVIAVISIMFLVLLLTSIYFSRVTAEKKARAENLLNGPNHIKEKIGLLHELGEQKVFMENPPSGWYLFSFTGKKAKPNACTDLKCICICDNVYKWGWSSIWGKSERQRQAEECDEDGVCLIVTDPPLFDYFVQKGSELEIETTKGDNLLIKKVSGFVDISKPKS